ncbi:MAG TPA: acyl-CoA dehydrogenase family protein [Acidimicrobiales bacterium]
MNLAFSEEQEELRSIVRQFLEAKSPEGAVRESMTTDEGYDPAVWAQMAEQLGLQSLIVPEEFGGQGFGYMELVIVLEEMGRALLCAPYFSTVALGVNTLLVAGDDAASQAILPGIATGETIATLALAEPIGRWDEAGVAAVATDDGGVWRITGTKSYVIDGHVADVVLVVARTANGISLFRVDGDAAGLTRTLLPTLDQTRKQAELVFEGVEGTIVGEEGAAWPVLSRVLDLAAVALAAEQVGGSQRCLDMAVQYAKDRVQFGRPIGSFQAIKHRCADLLLEVESARSAAYYAGACAADDSDELAAVASLAKAACSDTFTHVSGENIQIHGGIGFTWEHPAHLYFKRASAMSVQLGDTTYHRGLVADRAGF